MVPIDAKLFFDLNFPYTSIDPLPEHFESARKAILEDIGESGTLVEYIDKAVDLLARGLVKACNDFKKMTLSLGESEVNFFNHQIHGMLWMDAIFFDFISQIGKESLKEAEIQRNRSKNKWLKYFTSDNEDKASKIWSLWILDNDDPYSDEIAPKFLYILAWVLWLDVIKCQWEREIKNVPAITKGVLESTIKPPLSKDTRIEICDGKQITCYSESGNVVATVPCVDPFLVNLISKGMKAFSSLSGHKLLRWQVLTGFNNWVSNVQDPRLIRTSGGYEGIANLVGCGKSPATIKEIKSILYAQAHGHFNYPQGGNGNMIILREMEKHRNGESSKINIILGEMLLPNFTHHLPSGEGRRLIPIMELPPLIGSKNTHAAQAMLQLLILEEFSNQSDVLASKKCIIITMEKWKELARKAGLPNKCIGKVIEGWREAFLQKQGDEYTLSTEHFQVVDFLEYQGKNRLKGSERGKKSAVSRKTKNLKAT